MKLTDQQQKVYDYIKANPGCTTHDITRDTFIQKPCARISDLREKGVMVEIIGEVKYPGTKAFKKYSVTEGPNKAPEPSKQMEIKIINGVPTAVVNY